MKPQLCSTNRFLIKATITDDVLRKNCTCTICQVQEKSKCMRKNNRQSFKIYDEFFELSSIFKGFLSIRFHVWGVVVAFYCTQMQCSWWWCCVNETFLSKETVITSCCMRLFCPFISRTSVYDTLHLSLAALIPWVAIALTSLAFSKNKYYLI